MGVISENSLRVQEAARLTSSICKNSTGIMKMRGLQEEVKALTETYLQVTDNLKTVPLSDIHQLAKSELLQRQLLVKMKVLFGLVSSFNKEYSTTVEDTLCLAVSACTENWSPEKGKEAKAKFETDAEALLANVKAACQNFQDCLNYIRNPRVRANLRSINEHLSFQISDIVCRARQMVETQDLDDMHSVEIQMQYWSAMAHFLVDEMDMVEGVHQATKQQIRLFLQGRDADEAQNMPLKFLPNQEMTHPPDPVMASPQNPPVTNQELKRGGTVLTASRGAPSLTYTSLFLKRETDKWDAENNHIIQVTRAMAEKIYHMAQYLRRKGPIQSKEVFVAAAKEVVSRCQTVTQFVKVIADHSLSEHSKEDLCLILEKILTTTNQLTIISSVNALTPCSKSSDEILVKNAQNLLQIILQGVQAAETACIKGLRQPKPNSDGAEAAALCFQWRKSLQIHRAEQNSNLDTDDLGLRKTSLHPSAPSLAPPIQIQQTLKWPP
ncbi:vinculin [Conger conger]|uniref:vinculin n=1 Tax=Conger conger TaxID=82655 RepID=UPI002A5A1AF9|nr:vinculin [Conger conger]